ncbi:hypothetical protein [Nocardia callitridis]|uniref:Uncharacterized protein n=1 Tax=Nocardia callitridis TaxID=648753 RepID=A0ABP9K1Y7_9NOCA
MGDLSRRHAALVGALAVISAAKAVRSATASGEDSTVRVTSNNDLTKAPVNGPGEAQRFRSTWDYDDFGPYGPYGSYPYGQFGGHPDGGYGPYSDARSGPVAAGF